MDIRRDQLRSSPAADGAEAATPAQSRQRANTHTGDGPRYDIGSQQAGAIYQSGRDLFAVEQHNQLALKLEPMRRRARNVMRTGFCLLFGGFAVFAVGFALFAGTVVHGFNQPEAKPNLTGWAIAGVGTGIMALGVLVIVTSLFMKRGVRQEEQRS